MSDGRHRERMGIEQAGPRCPCHSLDSRRDPNQSPFKGPGPTSRNRGGQAVELSNGGLNGAYSSWAALRNPTTRSDATKLRLWTKENVAAPRILSPTRNDLNYLKRFLDETARSCNRRIGERLAELLSTMHSLTPNLFDDQETANQVAVAFRLPLKVAAKVGVVPAD